MATKDGTERASKGNSSTSIDEIDDKYRIREDERQSVSGPSNREFVLDRIRLMFYPLYRSILTEDGPTVRQFRRQLERAAISATVEDYVTRAMAIGTFLGAFLAGLGAIAGLAIVDRSIITLGIFPRESILALSAGFLAAGVLGAILGLAIGLGAAVVYPIRRAQRRRQKINKGLPDALNHMYSQASGGMSGLDIIRDLASTNAVNRELQTEFRKLVREIDLFNVDQRTALQTVADESPSKEFRDLLYEMTTNTVSGGDLSEFFEQKKDEYLRKRQRNLESRLDRMDTISRMFIPLALLPVLLVVGIAAVAIRRAELVDVLPVVVYVLVPGIGILFVVVASAITADELTERDFDTDIQAAEGSFLTAPIVEKHLENAEQAEGDLEMMRRNIYRQQILSDTIRQFRKTPSMTLLLTIPVAIVTAVLLHVVTVIEYAPEAFVASPILQTTLGVVVPVYIVLLPMGYFYERKELRRREIIEPLTSTLYELKHANDAGRPLLQAIEETADRGESLLARELQEIPYQVRFGSNLQVELARMASKYNEPRLTRTVRLISRAREASSNITDVLETAAKLSEQEDEFRKDRQAGAQMYIGITLIVFFVLVFVLLAVKVSLIGRIATMQVAAEETQFFQAFDPDFVNLMFFHMILMQAAVVGFVSGIMRTGKLRSGIKYVLALIPAGIIFWTLTSVFF